MNRYTNDINKCHVTIKIYKGKCTKKSIKMMFIHTMTRKGTNGTSMIYGSSEFQKYACLAEQLKYTHTYTFKVNNPDLFHKMLVHTKYWETATVLFEDWYTWNDTTNIVTYIMDLQQLNNTILHQTYPICVEENSTVAPMPMEPTTVASTPLASTPLASTLVEPTKVEPPNVASTPVEPPNVEPIKSNFDINQFKTCFVEAAESLPYSCTTIKDIRKKRPTWTHDKLKSIHQYNDKMEMMRLIWKHTDPDAFVCKSLTKNELLYIDWLNNVKQFCDTHYQLIETTTAGVPAQQLFNDFINYCEKNAIDNEMTRLQFPKYMEKLGYIKKRVSTGNVYLGLTKRE